MKRIIIIAFLIAAPISYAMQRHPAQVGLSLPANNNISQALEDEVGQIIEHIDKKAKSTLQYKCFHPDCVYRPLFASCSGLRMHERSHKLTLEEQRPYVCAIEGCTQRFAQAGHRDSHERTHAVEKQYICTLGDCTRSFARSNDLRAHQEIVHFGIPGHKCDACSRIFARESNLITHKRIHTREKPYACSCGSRFTRSDGLKDHLKRADSQQHTAIVAPQGPHNERMQRCSQLPKVIVALQASQDDDDDDDDSDNEPKVDNQLKVDNEVTAVSALVILHNQQNQQK
jgi:hypothetical protein